MISQDTSRVKLSRENGACWGVVSWIASRGFPIENLLQDCHMPRPFHLNYALPSLRCLSRSWFHHINVKFFLEIFCILHYFFAIFALLNHYNLLLGLLCFRYFLDLFHHFRIMGINFKFRIFSEGLCSKSSDLLEHVLVFLLLVLASHLVWVRVATDLWILTELRYSFCRFLSIFAQFIQDDQWFCSTSKFFV